MQASSPPLPSRLRWRGWLMRRAEIDRLFRGSFVCSYRRYFFVLHDGLLRQFSSARRGERELDSLNLGNADAVRPCAQVELIGIPYGE